MTDDKKTTFSVIQVAALISALVGGGGIAVGASVGERVIRLETLVETHQRSADATLESVQKQLKANSLLLMQVCTVQPGCTVGGRGL